MEINELIKLRHEIHRHPELSDKEYDTKKRILRFFEKLKPDKVIEFSGTTGFAFVFEGKEPGKTIMFRSELDALPIVENTAADYSSVNKGVAHSCGHDGHMSVLSGLGVRISENRPNKGRAVLLFQPAEETGQGAQKIVNSAEFQEIEPDYIFALHNIPRREKHKIIIKPGSFSAASTAMTLKLKGKTSHAAEPEKGISPANAVAELINRLHRLVEDQSQFSDFTLLTIINIQLGEIAFGTTPGYAEFRVTYRAFENKDMDVLVKKAEQIINQIAQKEHLKYEIVYSEIFPATENHKACVEYIKQAAQKGNFNTELRDNPFRWGEDFGYFTEKYPGGFFGLGAGKNQPHLHNSDYDFPDDIIETGSTTFYNIYEAINR
ncbi:MAG: amidohydrolase [Bacteroidota bacterium]|nr:amidohydrolase [Bacteroidota bacterium]